MVNQQLIDFIKSQIKAGVNKETIQKELLNNGWDLKDLEEGFELSKSSYEALNDNISTPEKKYFGKKISFVFWILIIVALGVSIYYFRDDIKNLTIINIFIKSLPF